MVPLKEITSYLKITPIHDHIRHKQGWQQKNKHEFEIQSLYSEDNIGSVRKFSFIFALSFV